jgi:hypothetical protein
MRCRQDQAARNLGIHARGAPGARSPRATHKANAIAVTISAASIVITGKPVPVPAARDPRIIDPCMKINPKAPRNANPMRSATTRIVSTGCLCRLRLSMTASSSSSAIHSKMESANHVPSLQAILAGRLRRRPTTSRPPTCPLLGTLAALYGRRQPKPWHRPRSGRGWRSTTRAARSRRTNATNATTTRVAWLHSQRVRWVTQIAGSDVG